MLEKLTSSPGGKAAVAVVAVLAVVLLGFLIKKGTELDNPGYGTQVPPEQIASDAEKALKNIESNPNIPESVKENARKKYAADIARAKGQAASTPSGPPQK